MDILVIGSGGREHAMIHALKRSPQAGTIYAAPGNGGILRDAKKADITVSNFRQVADFCKSHDISLVVVGPETPLVDGMVDALEKEGIRAFGPSSAAAQLEGSKGFMKDICRKYNIPTAEYERFTRAEDAKAYIKRVGSPIVIKADGLAAGKGVIIAQSEQEAFAAVDEMFAGKFGEAGNSIVIEEFLEGEEASFFVMCDGKHVIPFGSAQDHKRVGEGDTGPNTGGMGTYSPAPVVTKEVEEEVMKTIIHPTVQAMEKEGMPYKGFLFAGLMITKDEVKLLEFNVRFGDPETQVIMPRLTSDLVELMVAGAEGKLEGKTAQLSRQTALCVVMAANGYPESYTKGSVIRRLEEAEKPEDVIIFHAGTAYHNGQFTANGGRVLGITALGNNVVEAQKKAYQAVDTIDWKEGFCRRDIGWRAVEKFKLAG